MLISIIIPCFNEQESIPEIYSQLTSVMQQTGEEHEIIFIDDGSTDNSIKILNEIIRTDKRVVALEFSRNFGHQAAICAGLDHADGDAVIMMDADLQHPPHIVPALIERWKEGFDIVYTIRKDSFETTFLKKYTAKFFYKLINTLAKINIPENSADFRLLDKKVVHKLKNFKEKTIFLRGLLSWVGYQKYPIHYNAAPRYAGRSKYTLWKMIKFAFDGIVSFSVFPLHIATICGFMVASFSFIYAVYAIYVKLFTNETMPGWTSVLVAVLFLGGVQLLSLGIIGEYLGRVYEESKGRPTYIIKNFIGQSIKKNFTLE
jgi:polyisoprenyl-phosphate glycosyltransferase